MEKSKALPFLLFVAILCSSLAVASPSPSASQPNKGRWKLVKRSIGVSAMHMQLLPNDKIIAFDRTNFGPSNISLPRPKCVVASDSLPVVDCSAHSVEFDPSTRTIRPLTVLTDTWCSSGALNPDGVLLQSGGYRLGERVVRSLNPCLGCDWTERSDGLIAPRWYATSQILPDGRIVVVGGRYNFNYEFIPKLSNSDRVLYQLPFLKETRYAPLIPNNLYPFLHLSPDGNLFIFANDRAVLLDYLANKVVRRYPVIPGGFSRNYPSTGSSVLLPIRLDRNVESKAEAEVFVCGGTKPDSNRQADSGIFLPATNTCGRLVITSENSTWKMEEMPFNRVMGDMILLPTGDVLIINGAGKGTAGWNVAREPVLTPVIYDPTVDPTNGSRFEAMAPSRIPRLYHSTAHLLSDGRVLVGGSNPNSNYNFTALYPTELSLEAFYPPYLGRKGRTSRPSIRRIDPGPDIGYGQRFSVVIRTGKVEEIGKMHVTMVAPSFTTHSFAMNQRLLVLRAEAEGGGSGSCVMKVNAPAKAALAPPGYYQLFVVRDGVPSKGMWVRIR